MINYKYRIETGDRVEHILSDEIKITCYKGVDKNLETDLDKILTWFEIGKNSYGIELDDGYFDIGVKRIKEHIESNNMNVNLDVRY